MESNGPGISLVILAFDLGKSKINNVDMNRSIYSCRLLWLNNSNNNENACIATYYLKITIQLYLWTDVLDTI